jgi:hypothetical protein
MGDGHRSRVLVTRGSVHPTATGALIPGAGEPATANGMGAASRSVTGKGLPVTYVEPEQDLKSGRATGWPEFAEAAQ